MGVIFKISLRNLIRQKRRNLLLGLGIAFGMCLLVMANALGSGISDLLLNKMVESFSGHLFIKMIERDKTKWEIIRDKDRIQQLIAENIDGVKAIREYVAAHGKVLGNGKSLYGPIFGIDPYAEFFQGVPVVAGNLADLTDPGIEHPLALYERMAERLNVQVNDVISMRFESVYGQVQIARFTVVAIMKAVNPFFSSFMYCPLEQLKPLVGYQPHETHSLQIVLERVTDPQQITKQADQLHRVLQPKPAGYEGLLFTQRQDHRVTVLAVASNQEARTLFRSHLSLNVGTLDSVLTEEQTILISRTLADTLGVKIGDVVEISYLTRFEGVSSQKQYSIEAIFEANDIMQSNMVFVHPAQLYESVFQAPPRYPVEMSPKNALFPALVKEWDLLERTENQTSSQKKYRTLNLTGWRGVILDVQTIDEVAGEVLEFTQAVDLVTIIGIVILFFIIQIGVVNTLRMTIRERTREIGTVHAIGMQREEVRWSFVIEVVLLTLFACVAGIVLALLLIQGLSAIPIDPGDSEMGFFLVNNHLYFVPQVADLLRNLIIIVGIALLTAYFPARSAAKLSVVDALRHYE